MSTSNPDEQWKYVDCDKEAADLYIMNYVKAKDVVVTQDIGLAATLLPKDVYVISPRGESYTEDHIRTALDLRYLSAKARKKGIYGKGPKPFTDNDRLQFIKKFTEMLSKHEGIR